MQFGTSRIEIDTYRTGAIEVSAYGQVDTRNRRRPDRRSEHSVKRRLNFIGRHDSKPVRLGYIVGSRRNGGKVGDRSGTPDLPHGVDGRPITERRTRRRLGETVGFGSLDFVEPLHGVAGEVCHLSHCCCMKLNLRYLKD